jgi:GNAT superfamily N-acetyltransferase
MSPLEPSSAPTTEIQIREFQPGDEAAFRNLNQEWITRYFRLEPKDEVAFSDPQGTILAFGGRIFFAVAGDQYLGCCALVRIEDGQFEVAKMAVTPASQGVGIGRRLLNAAIEAGRIAGARRLYLETNHNLLPAIRLYESMGFKRLPPNEITPSPYERANVYMEMILA